MSVAAPIPATGISERRATVMGFVFLGLAAIMAVGFSLGAASDVHSTIGLNGGHAVHLGNMVVPTRVTSFVLAAVCAALGVIQLSRGFGGRTYPVLGLVALLFVLALLTWGARGAFVNLEGILVGTLAGAVVITFGGLSGLMCERSGVINIGIEGMLLTAAFTAAVVASAAGNLWLGMIVGGLTGAALAWVLAVLAIRYQVDQIIAGTFINLFALGITSYLNAGLLANHPDLNTGATFNSITVPGLSKIPVVGPVLFDQNVFVYILFAIIALIHVALFHTRYGLRVRAVGEHPEAADTVGIRVLFTRYRNVILGGLVAGIGGAYLTIGSTGPFDENISAGLGFIGLAAMIFGRYQPIGAFGAALVFGFANALQVALSILNVPIPSYFLLMTPYVVTIAVVAGLVRRARPPAADGKPYVRR